MEIRKIGKREIADILKFEHSFTSKWSPETYYKKISLYPDLVYGSFDNDKLVGFILGRRLSSGSIKISRFAVDKGYQHKGIGGRLIDTLSSGEGEKAKKIISIVREDNIPSVRLHEREGFGIIPKEFKYKDGTRGIRFRKRLLK